MKKKLLLLGLLLIPALISVSAETLNIEVPTYGSDIWANVSSYASTITSKVEIGGTSWDISNFNNNNNSWEYAKLGAKKATTTGTLSSKAPIEYAINKVTVSCSEVANGTVTGLSVQVSPNSDFSNSTNYDYAGDLTVGDWVVNITNPSANQYYKVSVTVENSTTNKNGVASISKFTFSYESAGGGDPTTYTVTYDANGGSGTMTDANSPYVANASVTTLDNSFTRDGYTFTSWNTTSEGDGTSYEEGASFTITDDVTLYAQWKAEGSTTATINFGSATGSTPINRTPVSGNDIEGTQWTVTTVGTSSFTQNKDYSQIGASSKPATSISAVAHINNDITITRFEAKLGGFSGTAGKISLKIGDNEVATGSLSASTDVTVSAKNLSVDAKDKNLSVSVTGIAKGVKFYYIEYEYTPKQYEPGVYTMTASESGEYYNGEVVTLTVNGTGVRSVLAGYLYSSGGGGSGDDDAMGVGELPYVFSNGNQVSFTLDNSLGHTLTLMGAYPYGSEYEDINDCMDSGDEPLDALTFEDEIPTYSIIQPSAVKFSRVSGTEVVKNTEVTITCARAQKICYTVDDGDLIEADGASVTVTITGECTIKAYGVFGTLDSAVAAATYSLIAAPACDTPLYEISGNVLTVTVPNAVKFNYYVKEDGVTVVPETVVEVDNEKLELAFQKASTLYFKPYNIDDVAPAGYIEKAISIFKNHNKGGLVQEIEFLEDGGKYVIVTRPKSGEYEAYKIMGAYNDNNKFTAVDVTYDGDGKYLINELPAGATVFTFAKSGDNWTLKAEGGYLSATSSSTNLNFSQTSTEASITISESNASIVFASGRQVLYYSDSRVFGNYSSSNLTNNNNKSSYSSVAIFQVPNDYYEVQDEVAAKAYMSDATYKEYNRNWYWYISGAIHGNHANVEYYRVDVYARKKSGAASAVRRTEGETNLVHTENIAIGDVNTSNKVEVVLTVPMENLGEGQYDVTLAVTPYLNDGTQMSTVYNQQVYSIDSAAAANNHQTGVEEVMTEAEEAAAEYYTLQGVRVASERLQPGLYIERRGGRTSKVMVR